MNDPLPVGLSSASGLLQAAFALMTLVICVYLFSKDPGRQERALEVLRLLLRWRSRGRTPPDAGQRDDVS